MMTDLSAWRRFHEFDGHTDLIVAELALLEVWVFKLGGSDSEFVVVPGDADVSLLVRFLTRFDRRNSSVEVGVDVPVGCVTADGRSVVATAGSRSLPIRARSCFVDCLRRLCMAGFGGTKFS